MYYLIVFILLILAVAILILSKSYPALKPAGAILPIVTLLILIFKPGSPSTIPVSKHMLNKEARAVGEQLAQTIIRTIPETGTILVIHPDKESTLYTLERIPEKLEGLENAFESSGYTLIPHALTQADAVNDLLTDGTNIGSQTLSKLVANQDHPVGIVLLGLHFAMGDEKPTTPIPPLILATIGNPAASDWALAHGVAAAALFEKDSAPLAGIKEKNLTAEEMFNLRFEIRTSK